MNEFRKDFPHMEGRFLDRSGRQAHDENTYWAPIVVTKKQIDAEAERLASLPLPANGRRESLIVHPLAEANAPGFAPGIQVKLSVLKPGEKTSAFRHNATEVNFCIGGSGHTLIAGRRIAFSQYDLWNHPSHAAYRHVNDGKNLQVRLTYSNVPLLQHMQVYLPEDEPSAELRPVEDAEEQAAKNDPRRKSPFGMIPFGTDGGMLMPYEILINPKTVLSNPLHFPWKDVKRELDKLVAQRHHAEFLRNHHHPPSENRRPPAPPRLGCDQLLFPGFRIFDRGRQSIRMDCGRLDALRTGMGGA